VRLLSTALKVIGDNPDIQRRLREDRSLLANFIEECLRIEEPGEGRLSDCRGCQPPSARERPRRGGLHVDGGQRGPPIVIRAASRIRTPFDPRTQETAVNTLAFGRGNPQLSRPRRSHGPRPAFGLGGRPAGSHDRHPESAGAITAPAGDPSLPIHSEPTSCVG